MAQISAYTPTSTVANDDYVLLDGTTNGTRRIGVDNLASEMDRLRPPIPTLDTASSIDESGYLVMIDANDNMKKVLFSDLVQAVINNIPDEGE